MLGTPEYRVPGLTFGAPYNYPQTLNQNNWTGRADFSLHKDKHDIKIGGEYIHVHNGGPWFIQRAGFFTFNSAPANLATVLPPGQELEPVGVEPGAAQPARRATTRSTSPATRATGRSTCRGRPTRSGSATTGASSSDLTINLGLRWDADPNQASPPEHRHQQHPDQQRDPGELQPPAHRHQRLRLQDRHPRLEEHRAARRLHLQRRRQATTS